MTSPATSYACPATLTVAGHRLRLSHTPGQYGHTLYVTLTHRVTRECGHLVDPGVYAGDHARDLRRAIARNSLVVAEMLGASAVQIEAATRNNGWVIEQLSVARED